jgi:carboxypeptidase Taq
MSSAIQGLREHLAEIEDFKNAASVLGWDQQTYMPPGGGPRRAEVLSTLSRLTHSRFTSHETARMLDAAEKEAEGLDTESDEARLVHMVRRDFEKSRKLPDDFVAAWTQDAVLSNQAWRVARPADDFASFRPHLEKMVDYARRQAEYYGYEDHPYDALLDDYEPGMSTADVRGVFDVLRAEQVPLAKAIAEKPQPRNDFLSREFPEQQQEEFAKKVIADFGYDFKRGRLDIAPHPFETTFGRDDVRITTRYDRHFLPQAVFAVFHESGHAMYEQNISPSLARTPISHGCSMVLHESQSRLWENIVGRSRGLWNHYYPLLQEKFPEALRDVTVDEWHRAINRVRPSLIRVESDEVTYNLHIMVRFEIELELVTGTLKVSDLPEAWNARMEEYIGVTPPDNRDGVMQDTHWSSGSIGYFPTYALGNVLAAQIYETVTEEEPQIEAEIARGQFGTLYNWLADNVYRHGRKFMPTEMMVRINGAPLDAAPYIAYLKRKYGELYGV